MKEKVFLRFILTVFCNGLLFCLAPVAFGNANQGHYEELFTKGNEAYTKNNFDSAIIYYEGIVNAGFESGILYYNLGNSYYKKRNIPAAILYFEKAKKLVPDDSDVLFNLQLANQQITDMIEPLPDFFLNQWWKTIISSASVDAWGRWSIVFAFYSVIMLMFFIFSESAGFRKLFFWSGLTGLIFTVFTLYFAFEQEKNLVENNEAIVFSSTVTTKSSPGDNSTNLFVIHQGTKVKILERVNGWIKIAIPDGNIGWIISEEVREI